MAIHAQPKVHLLIKTILMVRRILADRKVSGLDSFSYGFSAGSNFRIRDWKTLRKAAIW